MDVMAMFLNALIEEKVYINQLRGIEVLGQESHVPKLKVIYEMKHEPHA
jgi:hypothetical protein